MQNNQRIDQEAAHWAVRLSAGALDLETQAQLDQWLDADPRHRGALLRARAAWADLDRLAALSGHREPQGPMEMSPKTNLASRSARSFANRRFFLAASISALLFGSGTWVLLRRNGTYVSKLGEVRRVTLADGSHMVLNTATEASVHFDTARREINLSAGEGLFQVVKDPKRPFIVRAGGVSVRAVGTVFTVRNDGNQVDVLVTEGVVELTDHDSGVVRRVAANERATVMDTRQVAVAKITQAQAERRLAWRDGMVDFDGDSLSHAVDEMNRHNDRRIFIDDQSLGSRPIVGRFRANDPDGFAATVSVALGVQTELQGDAIHLNSRIAP
ncbi:MAG TPA: FecR domain-containing protein [Steroidobacteraceae bacterium]